MNETFKTSFAVEAGNCKVQSPSMLLAVPMPSLLMLRVAKARGCPVTLSLIFPWSVIVPFCPIPTVEFVLTETGSCAGLSKEDHKRKTDKIMQNRFFIRGSVFTGMVNADQLVKLYLQKYDLMTIGILQFSDL